MCTNPMFSRYRERYRRAGVSRDQAGRLAVRSIRLDNAPPFTGYGRPGRDHNRPAGGSGESFVCSDRCLYGQFVGAYHG